MTKTYKHHPTYGGGIIRQCGNQYQAEFTRNNLRRRQNFDTREDAENWIDAKRLEFANLGARAFTLTERQRLDAVQAIEVLEDTPLVTAAIFYVAHNRPAGGARTVQQVYDEYLAAKKKKGLRPASIASIENMTGKVATTFADRQIHTITGADLQAWMDSHDAISPATRRIYKRYAGLLFGFAQKRQYRPDNPAKEIDRDQETPLEDGREVETFTVAEVEGLLRAAAVHVPRIVPYMALGFFAGLRCGELDLQDWRDIDLEGKSVHVTAKASKVRKGRYVTMSDNLFAWLLPHRRKRGPVAPAKITRRRAIATAMTAAKIKRWARNGLRHSFGSYHLAFYQDAPKTAFQMGHRNATMLYTHYNREMKPADAAKYWQIFPKATKEIQFPLAAEA